MKNLKIKKIMLFTHYSLQVVYPCKPHNKTNT